MQIYLRPRCWIELSILEITDLGASYSFTKEPSYSPKEEAGLTVQSKSLSLMAMPFFMGIRKAQNIPQLPAQPISPQE
jgi:hypothetical protein